jgi:hypothetical protein
MVSISLVVTFTTNAQDNGAPLQRRVSSDQATARLASHVASLLRKAGTWGGVEEYRPDCRADLETKMPAFEGTLQEGLLRLKGKTQSLSWRVDDGGVIVSNGFPATSILDSNVDQFTFNIYDPPDRITDLLLSQTKVASEIATRKLSVRSPELGFAQARVDSQEKITLRNVSLRQTLNGIAHSIHARPRVWLFDETTCSGHSAILVQWLVK